MVKEAYRKLFTKRLPVLFSSWICLAIIEFLFRFAGSDFLFAHPNNPPAVRLLAWAAVCAPFVITAVFLARIGRFRRSLREYGDGNGALMEEEFFRGAHFGDLHFTRACLVLHSTRNWDCLPYQDIKSVNISATARQRGERILEIHMAGKRVYRLPMPASKQLSQLEALLHLYRSGTVTVPTVSEECAARDAATERAASRRDILRSPQKLMLISFALLFVHLLGFWGLFQISDMTLKNPQLSLRASAHLLLWTSLLIIVWTLIMAAAQLLLLIRAVRAAKTSGLDASHAAKAVMGILLFMGMSLFLPLACILSEDLPAMINQCVTFLFS